ncbi:acylglycerol kinase family protein [Pseudonocardia halophobica]|uniref:acylglycerol kinase family protein n=1 Tax=Pseudonocardia halophobica TaxID=29401 RepID=UPI003D8BBF3D
MTAEAVGSPHVITDSPFDRIVVIFNPHSAGSAAEPAEGLCAVLTRRLPRTSVHLSPTEHAGHARDLARNAARIPRSLIVSVSGDGGYNEVVDGVMQAGDTGTVCAVMAAGNANDHRRATGEQPPGDAIVAGEVRHLDLLRLTIGHGPDAVVRYAHSCIGMGLTPIVALDLEKGGKGSLREIVSVVRTFAVTLNPLAVVLATATGLLAVINSASCPCAARPTSTPNPATCTPANPNRPDPTNRDSTASPSSRSIRHGSQAGPAEKREETARGHLGWYGGRPRRGRRARRRPGRHAAGSDRIRR